MTTFPSFMATGIGSMPFDNPEYAVNLSLSTFPEAPFWPQLPKRGLTEQMEVQYSEGIPRAVVDRENNRLTFDTTGDFSGEFAAFYETYMTGGDFSSLAITPAFSAGLYLMESKLKARSRKLPFVKVQTTGPCSFALTVVDENKRAIFYNDMFRDVIVKALAMKCRWQIRKFQPFADRVICFVDEPILSAYGSSTYVSVKREDVVSLLREMADAIHADRALAGVHCCGNTEWSILVDAGIDIISFDAFEFGETMAMYPEAIRRHLGRGGLIAWGIVPTSDAIVEQTPAGLAAKLTSVMDLLAAKGIDKPTIAKSALVTPSCGTGSMSPAPAEKVFQTTAAVSALMRQQDSAR
ncbi:MAG: hypothetical protein HY343_09010 [Lentisphaerae bacterium]|nr:hypothetical protein [Lentisphaerota bacterium]